jgi:hypothetical protein
MLIFGNASLQKDVTHGEALTEKKKKSFFLGPMILGGYQTGKNKGVRYFAKNEIPTRPFCGRRILI